MRRICAPFRVGCLAPDLLDKPDLTLEDVRADVERYSGTRVSGVSWFETYGSHQRIADRFRRDQVFLLGDAAHIHSALAGQGINTRLMMRRTWAGNWLPSSVGKPMSDCWPLTSPSAPGGRKPVEELVHLSDRGSQFTSLA
jgi:FAD binding domain